MTPSPDAPVSSRGGRQRASLPSAPAATLARLLGTDAAAAGPALADLLVAATGRRPLPGSVTVETVPHSLGSPATGGVHRVRGTSADGESWSMFCKVLQHARHWAGLHHMPPAAASRFADSFPWRSELELSDPRVQASLPTGLRSPHLHRLVDLGDDRVAVWQEDVEVTSQVWDDAAYSYAAHLLGRWNARSTAPEVLAVSDYPPGYALRMYAELAVPMRGLPALADEQLWAHPWLVGHGGLADELTALGRQIPQMLTRLDTFTQTLPHGDASPQNLLVPAGGEDGLVVIDVSFRSPHALGFDLGQLLVGLVHCDVVPATRLHEITAVIVPAYVDGLAAEGLDADHDDVLEAFATATLLRSGFDGFLYDELAGAGPQEQPSASFTQRVELARYLTDLHLETTSITRAGQP